MLLVHELGTAFFGAHQGEFNYDPPSGFKALSSKNLPKPTTPIINPDQHFKAPYFTLEQVVPI